MEADNLDAMLEDHWNNLPEHIRRKCMDTHGLFMTKAAPFHNGHIYCIQQGLTVCDKITVLVYDTDVIDIPVETRVGWIKDHFKDRGNRVNVIGVFGAPKQDGYTPEIMKAHEDFVYDRLGMRGRITHVISSEPYGSHMAKAIGAIDYRVDEARTIVPVSGTAIRKRPHMFKEFMPREVYRSFVTKVLVIGAPSTGKTTLIQALSKRVPCTTMHEHGRDYWQQHQVNRKLANWQLTHLAKQHRELENSKIFHTLHPLCFVDTAALTTMLFAREYWGEAEPELIEMAKRTAQDYDLIVYINPTIPFDDTPERDGESERQEMHRRYIDIIKAWNIPVTYISTTDMNGRIQIVTEALEEIRNELSGY